MDILGADMALPWMWYYEQTLDHNKILSSFKDTVVHYPFLCGSYSKEDLHMNQDNSGIPFEVRTNEQSIHDIIKRLQPGLVANNPKPCFLPIEVYKNLLPTCTDTPYDAVLEGPMMRVRVTLCNPGTVISMLVQHVVTDSEGLLSFVCNWSRVYRGIGLKPIPEHDRSLSSLKVDESEMPPIANLGIIKRAEKVGACLGSMDLVPMTPDHIGCTVPFTNEALYALKIAGNKGLEKGKYVSTNDVITAMVWRAKAKIACEILGIPLDSLETTTLIRAMNVRERTIPPLTGRYFGGAVLPAVNELSVKDLLSMSVQEVALKLREALVENTPGAITAELQWINAMHKDGGALIFDSPSKAPSFMITSWSFGLCWEDAVFGSKPLAFDYAGHVPYATVYTPRPDGDGFTIWTSGSPKAMDAFIAEMNKPIC